jgi:CHAT domain-containing protein/Tfp pilus assembly protein PilF
LALVAALCFTHPGRGQVDDPFALYARVLELRRTGNLEEAIALAKRVVELSEKTLPSDHPFIKTSRDNLAALHREKGDEIGALNRRVAALYRAGKIAEAAPLAERMLELIRAQKGEDHADTASGMVWLGLLYKQLDRLADAEPLLKRALDNSERTQPANSSLVATRAHHLAGLYQDQGRSDEAEALYKRALAIREGLPAEPLALAATLSSLATLHSSQGKLAEAERLYKRSLEIRQSSQPGNHADIAQDLHNLATFYSNRGRYAEAELLFKRALEIIEQALPAGHPNIARVLNGLAFSYREQGRYAEAEPLHKRVVEINERAYPAGHSIIAQSLYNLGLVYHAQRRLDEAETLYRRALEAREKALWPGHPEIAWSLHNLAGLHYERRKFGEAEQLLQRALEMREKVLPALDNAVALNLNNLAAAEYGRQAWEAAVRYARRAGTIVVQRTKRETRSAAIEPTETASAELANNDSAFFWLRAAAWRLAEQQPGQHAALSEETYTATQWAFQSSAASALAQMAGRFSKGDGELSRLVRERQDASASWQRLDKELIAARSTSPEKRNAAAEQALLSRIAETERRLTELGGFLAKDFPEYAALAAPEPLSFKATQELLRTDEALILFANDQRETFIWVVTRTDTRWVRSDMGAEALLDQVAGLRCGLDATLWHDATDWSEATGELARQKAAQIARRARCEALVGAKPKAELVGQTPIQVLPFDAQRAHALYKALFGQVEDLIGGKKLLIVPSGPLTSLPLSVLVTEPPKTAIPATLGDYRAIAWLATQQPVTVLPSVASLKSLRQSAKASRASGTYLGIGNPLLDGPQDDPRWGEHYKTLAQAARDSQQCAKWPAAQRTAQARGPRAPAGLAKTLRGARADIAQVRAWTPLPETADELCEIGHRLGVPESQILLGGRATETALKELSDSGRLADYAILHFATHGALTGQVQGLAEPGLVLTPPVQGTTDATALERDDGFLTGSEIATLKLDADWVILSACNTAGGAGETAEPLSGMARAFFYAGARALLVSHWEVGSDAAVKLTTRTFAELRANPAVGRAEALRVSMRELIETGTPAQAHPSMWAPFVVVGEGSAQEPEPQPTSSIPQAPAPRAPSTARKAPASKKLDPPDWRSQIFRQ